MIFKKIGNMENVEAICHYFLFFFPEHPVLEIARRITIAKKHALGISGFKRRF